MKWRLSIPATVSITGRQERRWFDSRKEAQAEVDRLKLHQKQVGSSAKLLDASRLLEAADAWLKSYLDLVHQKKVSDLTVSDITVAFAHLPDGNRNSNVHRPLVKWEAAPGEKTKDQIFEEILRFIGRHEEISHQQVQQVLWPPIPSQEEPRELKPVARKVSLQPPCPLSEAAVR